MTKSSLLTLAIILALVVWLFSIGLFLELGQHDPYSWAFPGIESDLSRTLHQRRQSLYIKIGLISFGVAIMLGVVKLFLNRWHRRSPMVS